MTLKEGKTWLSSANRNVSPLMKGCELPFFPCLNGSQHKKVGRVNAISKPFPWLGLETAWCPVLSLNTLKHAAYRRRSRACQKLPLEHKEKKNYRVITALKGGCGDSWSIRSNDLFNSLKSMLRKHVKGLHTIWLQFNDAWTKYLLWICVAFLSVYLAPKRCCIDLCRSEGIL